MSLGATVEREERELAGRTSGLLFFLGGLTLVLLAVLPGVTHAHDELLYGCAASSCLWGVCQTFVVDWNRAPWWLIHVSNVASLALIAVVVAATGGGRSPAWVYMFVVVVPAAYFYRAPVAIAYMVGCVLTQAAVLVYDPAARHEYFLPQFAIAAPSYLALGLATLAGKRLLRTLRRRAEQLAAEQGALRRVATAVVSGGSAEDVYELVAREAGGLLGCGAAGIMRVDGPDSAIVMGSWADRSDGRYPAGTQIVVRSGGDVSTAIKTRRPVLVPEHQPGSAVDRLGYRCSIVTPVLAGDKVWGVLAATSVQANGLDVEDERLLAEFADLLQMAIASIEDRARLAALASSDALTGLANRRTLNERLAAEVTRTAPHISPLAVALIDIDHFKEINDRGGHEAGDEILVWVAECLSTLAGSEDTLARIGGDEFAWVLPATTSNQALIKLERARDAIAQNTSTPNITVSAGVCDSGWSQEPGDLIRCADLALYWSKQHGRDQVRLYDQTIATQLAASSAVAGAYLISAPPRTAPAVVGRPVSAGASPADAGSTVTRA